MSKAIVLATRKSDLKSKHLFPITMIKKISELKVVSTFTSKTQKEIIEKIRNRNLNNLSMQQAKHYNFLRKFDLWDCYLGHD